MIWYYRGEAQQHSSPLACEWTLLSERLWNDMREGRVLRNISNSKSGSAEKSYLSKGLFPNRLTDRQHRGKQDLQRELAEAVPGSCEARSLLRGSAACIFTYHFHRCFLHCFIHNEPTTKVPSLFSSHASTIQPVNKVPPWVVDLQSFHSPSHLQMALTPNSI